MRKILLSAFFFGSLFMVGCSSTTDTQAGSALYCTVSSAVITGTNQVSLTINAANGTPNYTVSSVTASGYAGSLVSGATAFTGATTAIVQFGTLTSTSLQSASGSVTILDSASPQATASCTFSLATTTTTTTDSLCSLTPSTTAPGLNQTVTFTASGIGGTAPYTFTTFNPGQGYTSGSLTSISTTQATVSALYQIAGVSTPSVQVSDAAGRVGSCSTTISVQATTTGGTTTGGPACTLTLNSPTAYRGQAVSANAVITAQGAGNVLVTNIRYLTSSQPDIYFTGPLSAYISFPYQGTWPIIFDIEDAYGTRSSCQTSLQVY